MKGTIKFFHNKKQYGFIETDDQEDDVFFHISDVDGEEVEEGADVEFETEESDRGPKAVDVTFV